MIYAMWKPIEIVCLVLFLCCIPLCVYFLIRHAWSEAGLLSRDFFKCGPLGKVLWVGIMAIIAVILLILPR
jgi:hypothetical protein